MSGFREQEAMHVTWNNVRFNANIIEMRWKPQFNWTPKAYKEREVSVPDELLEILEVHRRSLPVSRASAHSLVFSIVDEMTARHAAAAFLRQLTIEVSPARPRAPRNVLVFSALKGHEMLVASSNNKAIENVSKELPAEGAVAHSREQLSYFKSISDLVHGPRKQEEEATEESLAPGSVKTWGLIAAVLGNKSNRSAFWKAFWWNEDRGFRTYLKTAMGHSVLIENRAPATGVVEKRTPEVVLREHPPSPQQAKENWPKARTRFLTLKVEIDAELQALEEVRLLCLALGESRRQLAGKERELESLQAERDEFVAKVETLRKAATLRSIVQSHQVHVCPLGFH